MQQMGKVPPALPGGTQPAVPSVPLLAASSSASPPLLLLASSSLLPARWRSEEALCQRSEEALRPSAFQRLCREADAFFSHKTPRLQTPVV